jgi:hypothetical protein
MDYLMQSEIRFGKETIRVSTSISITASYSSLSLSSSKAKCTWMFFDEAFSASMNYLQPQRIIPIKRLMVLDLA